MLIYLLIRLLARFLLFWLGSASDHRSHTPITTPFQYLKNRSSGINGITPYELVNHAHSDLSHLKVVGSRAWIHIAKEKKFKLDIRSWQGISIGYEGTNQYRVYNLCTGKIHITRDLFVDEQHLYHREALNDWDYSEDDWVETDDAQFAVVSDFNDLKIASSMLPDNSLHSVGENISKQLETEGNDSPDREQDMISFDDQENELSEPPEELLEISSGGKESLRRSVRTRAPRTLYSDQITHSSTKISSRVSNISVHPDQNLDSRDMSSSLARFASTCVLQLHIHMIQNFRMLEANVDNAGDDEPDILKQAIFCSDWPK